VNSIAPSRVQSIPGSLLPFLYASLSTAGGRNDLAYLPHLMSQWVAPSPLRIANTHPRGKERPRRAFRIWTSPGSLLPSLYLSLSRLRKERPIVPSVIELLAGRYFLAQSTCPKTKERLSCLPNLINPRMTSEPPAFRGLSLQD
jgi:hypothetical protein